MTNASATKILSKKTRTMTKTTVSTISRKTSLTTGPSSVFVCGLDTGCGRTTGGAVVDEGKTGPGSFSPSLSAIRHLSAQAAGRIPPEGACTHYAGIAHRCQGD